MKNLRPKRLWWMVIALAGALASPLVIPGCSSSGGSSGPPATLPTTGPMATLTIRVTDVRNKKGQLLFGIFTTSAGFPSDRAKSVNWQTRTADSETFEFIATLPPGRYGASVLHDENSNDKMDMNFLIPAEGYGVTNNPKPRFRSATFTESMFDLPIEGKSLTISLQYF